MSNMDDRLQKSLEDIEGGRPLKQSLDELPEDAHDLTSLIRLASTVRDLPHPEPKLAWSSVQQPKSSRDTAAHPALLRKPFILSWKRLAFAGGALGAGMLFLLALVAIFSLGVWFNGPRNARTAILMDVVGNVEVSLDGAAENWQPAYDGGQVHMGAHIRTDADGSAILVFYEGSRVTLGANTDLTLTRIDGGWGNVLQVLFDQRSGKTTHSVIPLRSTKSTYQVQTLSGAAQVRGTTFRVDVAQNGQSRFSVNTGKVLVASLNSEVLLDAGQATLALPGQLPQAPAYQFTYQGVVSGVYGDAWLVDDVLLNATGDTIVEGDPEVGTFVLVEGRILNNQSLVIDRLETFPDEIEGSSFCGVIESMDGQIWVISGQSVMVNDQTHINADLTVGDTVKVEFILQEDGSWLALEIESLEGEEEPEPEESEEPHDTEPITPTETISGTLGCVGADPHPVGQKLAERYSVPYEEIMGWFCQHFGFGEIDLAYGLSQEAGLPAADIFAMKSSGQGWGRIKQQLSLTPTSVVSDTLGATTTPAPSKWKNKSCPGLKLHPKGQALAQRFAVPYEEIMAWYCQGHSMGDIQQAYSLNQQTSVSVSDLLSQRTHGKSWKKILEGSQETPQPPGHGKPKKTPKPKPTKKPHP